MSGLSRGEALGALADSPHIILCAPMLASRLGVAEISGLDLLELWAFVHPAQFLVPSARALAAALGLPAPGDGADEARLLQAAAAKLARRVVHPRWAARAGAAESLERLARRGWTWAGAMTPLLPPPEKRAAGLFEILPQFDDAPPRAAPHVVLLDAPSVAGRLRDLAGSRREPRPGQQAVAAAMMHGFQPRESEDGPNLVLARAGTGIGKTLGYLAPASLWAERSGGVVWISTYTRALQRQLRAEAGRSLPEMVAAGRVVVRKGRENYLCLLNLEDAQAGAFTGRAAIFAELVARWARFSADGDMVGGDLPGWLAGLFRRSGALPALTDRRGECIRAACPHFRRCFIERSIRAGDAASIVIANHALVMANAVRARAEGSAVTRMVFDEGHHLESAADSAFSVLLSGGEAIELRRWLLGPEREARRAGRRRGLAARLTDISSHSGPGGTALEAVLDAARALPASDWLSRIAAGEPSGAVETLLAEVRTLILARAPEGDADRGFTLETEIAALPPALLEAAGNAAGALHRLKRGLDTLRAALDDVVKAAPEWLDSAGEARLIAAEQGCRLRGEQVAQWEKLLARVAANPDPDFVDWFGLVRGDGRELDCGIWRHWLDPTRPLAGAVLAPAHGVVLTSATLPEPLEAAGGAAHLAVGPRLIRVESPFDYKSQARVIIVTDVTRGDAASLANAYGRLIEAAGGGTLGLFTAIARLRAVHSRIADRLARAGLPLLAQHVDSVDSGTLVDLFRADPHASLFGTDALRDGVDVPGSSLRQIIFEGVPWSRPTVLNAARRAAFGGASHEDAAVRGRLAQAFGRLIRKADDRGVFVLLGAAVPSRLLDCFPAGVPVERMGLADAIEAVRASLAGACEADASAVTEGQIPPETGTE